jgi:hypothetical protein
MKLITVVQAGALLLLAMFGAYASAQQPEAKTCATTMEVVERCGL